MDSNPSHRVLCSVAILSAAVLAFEISLMRVVLVASWHHFAFLVVSVALLGFGASGTFLFLMRPILMPRAAGALFFLPPHWLPLGCGMIAAMASIVLTRPRMSLRVSLVALPMTIAFVWLVNRPPLIRADPLKYSSYVHRLQAQGAAEQIACVYT